MTCPVAKAACAKDKKCWKLGDNLGCIPGSEAFGVKAFRVGDLARGVCNGAVSRERGCRVQQFDDGAAISNPCTLARNIGSPHPNRTNPKPLNPKPYPPPLPDNNSNTFVGGITGLWDWDPFVLSFNPYSPP